MPMTKKHVPDGRRGDVAASSAELRICSRHGRVTTFHRTETGTARKVHHRHTDVPKVY